jgi:hypothetical protein
VCKELKNTTFEKNPGWITGHAPNLTLPLWGQNLDENTLFW